MNTGIIPALIPTVGIISAILLTIEDTRRELELYRQYFRGCRHTLPVANYGNIYFLIHKKLKYYLYSDD